MWKKDPTVWKDDPEHETIIRNALGWLKIAETMQPHVAELVAFAEDIRKAEFEYAVVLGMGGSSLCPEVLGRTFGKKTATRSSTSSTPPCPRPYAIWSRRSMSARRSSSCRRSRATQPNRRCFSAISMIG